MGRKHILIPIDRSKFSQKILPHIDLLCAPESYKLTLLYVAREVTSYDILRKEEGTWDNGWIAKPSVTYDGTTFRMWYNGVNKLETIIGFGYATSPNGTDWTKYTNNPVMIQGESGSWYSLWIQNPTVVFDGTT